MGCLPWCDEHLRRNARAIVNTLESESRCMDTQTTVGSVPRNCRLAKPVFYLCGGLQGSGSTLVSWCFLQRADMRGVLDATFDLVPSLSAKRAGQIAWYKTTIACFRLVELAEHYADSGWEVRPLLVVRDVRKAWASLISKPYGRNGTTAEDPPLRLRFRRFLADWQHFRAHDLPIVQFERLVSEPEATLRRACDDLSLEWDQGMLTWPKRLEDLGDQQGGNATFLRSRANSLEETLRRQSEHDSGSTLVAADDWRWLEREFAEYNQLNGYEPELPQLASDSPSPQHSRPSFAVTRRYRWETKRKPFRRLLSLLGVANRRLIQSRSPEKLL